MIRNIKDVSCTVGIMEEFHNSSERVHDFVGDIFIKSWNNLIKSGVGRAYIWEDDEIKGLLLSTMLNDLYDGKKTAMIAVWYVNQYYRGLGIGSALYKVFEHDASKAGSKRFAGGYKVGDSAGKAFLGIGMKPFEIYCVKTIG